MRNEWWIRSGDALPFAAGHGPEPDGILTAWWLRIRAIFAALRRSIRQPDGAQETMASMLSIYFTLALSAFLAATLIPLGSEVAVGAAILAGADPWVTLMIASTANTAGSVVNWMLGRAIERFRNRRWFPVSARQLEMAQQRFTRYGRWSLLFAWLPVVGDPLTFVAGILRIRFTSFVLLVAIGKSLRYAVLIFLLNHTTA